MAIERIREEIGYDEGYTVNHLIEFMYQIIIDRVEALYGVDLGDAVHLEIN